MLFDSVGHIFWMIDVSSYSNSSKAAKSITLITNEYNKSREDFIEHFKRTYTDPFPPAWITAEILPLGNMTWLYSNLADQIIRKAIAKILHLQAPVLDSWMTVITLTRNSCCHHARMWNKINPIIPNDMKNDFKNKLTGTLNLFPEIDLRAMGFNAKWEQEHLWR